MTEFRTNAPKIFLSYRRDDTKHIAGHICDRLEDHFGCGNIFLDVDDIPPGSDFRSYIDLQVAKCNVLLAIIGKQWLEPKNGKAPIFQNPLDDATDFVRKEIEAALERGIPVIPVLIDDARMPGEPELPEKMRVLAYLQAIEVRSGIGFRSHLQRLIQAIDEALQPKVQEARNRAETERQILEQEEIRQAAEMDRLRAEREEAYRQAEAERQRREREVDQWKAEADRLRLDTELRFPTMCPDCRDPKPIRCASCHACFTCLGESPSFWRKVLFADGYNCKSCSSDMMNYNAPS